MNTTETPSDPTDQETRHKAHQQKMLDQIDEKFRRGVRHHRRNQIRSVIPITLL